ncbi:hypothetical protein VP01_2060g5 [Puccinia sorghi]|uniref:Uncharacterized protein n=1 Tax=Puccinia sorghi TaxID=27349 RepID=A0A0L6VCK7_9BASI|nr:hypothetical protein VP01_2060g5 [Puccinia sorghi]
MGSLDQSIILITTYNHYVHHNMLESYKKEIKERGKFDLDEEKNAIQKSQKRTIIFSDIFQIPNLFCFVQLQDVRYKFAFKQDFPIDDKYNAKKLYVVEILLGEIELGREIDNSPGPINKHLMTVIGLSLLRSYYDGEEWEWGKKCLTLLFSSLDNSICKILVRVRSTNDLIWGISRWGDALMIRWGDALMIRWGDDLIMMFLGWLIWSVDQSGILSHLAVLLLCCQEFVLFLEEICLIHGDRRILPVLRFVVFCKGVLLCVLVLWNYHNVIKTLPCCFKIANNFFHRLDKVMLDTQIFQNKKSKQCHRNHLISTMQNGSMNSSQTSEMHLTCFEELVL